MTAGCRAEPAKSPIRRFIFATKTLPHLQLHKGLGKGTFSLGECLLQVRAARSALCDGTAIVSQAKVGCSQHRSDEPS